MPKTRDDPGPVRRRDRTPEGEAWDDGTWVDVGTDDHWRPTFEERSRSAVIFAVVVGVLLLAAAFASIDDGDGDDGDVVTTPSTTTETTQATTSTTQAPIASSVDGATPPEGCEDDDRGALPLRERSVTTVRVLNGTPKGGHAGATTDDVEALGYTTMEPDNASIRPSTSIDFLPGYCAEAARLAFELGIGGATYQPLREDSDVFLGRAVLVLTVGRDSL